VKDYARRPNPVSSESRNSVRNRKKITFARPAAAIASPAKPKIPAIIATIRNINAQFNMAVKSSHSSKCTSKSKNGRPAVNDLRPFIAGITHKIAGVGQDLHGLYDFAGLKERFCGTSRADPIVAL